MIETKKIGRLLAAFAGLLLLAACVPPANDPNDPGNRRPSGGGADPDIPPYPPPTGPEWRCDVDGNGEVSIEDVDLAQAFVTGNQAPTSVEFQQADVSPIGDPDFELDSSDVLVLLRASNGEDELCFISGTPPLAANQAAYEWQAPSDLGVGAPHFPEGPYVDVTDVKSQCGYCENAVADGVTNDAPAISRAIEYACAVGISNVYLPAGEYAIGPTSGVGYRGIGYETYMCPGTVEIFGDGPETVLKPNSTGGNFLFHVCYDWGDDIDDWNWNRSHTSCDYDDQVYVETSRLVLHDMTWFDPDPVLHSSDHLEESHGLKTFPTLGSLEVYNITVRDLGDEAMDLNMHPESTAWLHHNEFYGVPSIGGGSAYAAYAAGTVVLEKSVIDTLGGTGLSSRWGSCFDINPNGVSDRPLRDVVIRNNWCLGRQWGAKVVLSGDDDESIDWLEITDNYIEIAPHRNDASGNSAAMRLRPNTGDGNDAFILGGLIARNELVGPVKFDTDGIFDLEFAGNSVRPATHLLDQRGIVSAEPTNPVVIHAAHALEDGQEVVLFNVSGMEELNGRRFTVANSVPGNTSIGSFELLGEDGTGRQPGSFGAMLFEVPDFHIERAYAVGNTNQRIRLNVDQTRLAVGDLIETSGFHTMDAIDQRRFLVTVVGSDAVELQVDDTTGYPEDWSESMRIRLLADGPGVRLAGGGITFANNTVSGFTDGCLEYVPLQTTSGASCEDGKTHTVDLTIVDNDFDCWGGESAESHYIVSQVPWGEYCDPEEADTGEFVISGNTFRMDKAQSKARGAISIAGDWEGLQIEDNRIYRPSNKTGGTAILVSRANDPTIARNEIRWAGEGVRIQQLDDAVVEDNGIELFGTAGYYDAGIELNGVVGAAVSRNTTCGATGIWGDGVAIHGGGNHVLSDNQNLPTGCLASP